MMPRQGPRRAGGGAATRTQADFVVQWARVGGSSTSSKTGALQWNVEGPPSADGRKQSSLGMDVYGMGPVLMRPPAPDGVSGFDRGADALCLRTSDGLVPIAARDVRLSQMFPNLSDGDVVLTGYGHNFVKLDANGGIAIGTTTDGTPQGQLVQIQLSGNGYVLLGPWGKITYGEDGFHLLHHTGARIDLGGVGGLPAPFDSLGNYALIGAAMVAIQASTVALGPTGAPRYPVTRATPLAAALGAVSTALATIATALGSLGGIATNSAASAQCSAAATALGAAVSAIASATVPGTPASIHSDSTTVS